jgi:hypothetical protein
MVLEEKVENISIEHLMMWLMVCWVFFFIDCINVVTKNYYYIRNFYKKKTRKIIIYPDPLAIIEGQLFVFLFPRNHIVLGAGMRLLHPQHQKQLFHDFQDLD